jgi:hypothetical protein
MGVYMQALRACLLLLEEATATHHKQISNYFGSVLSKCTRARCLYSCFSHSQNNSEREAMHAFPGHVMLLIMMHRCPFLYTPENEKERERDREKERERVREMRQQG